ncbi:MAG: tetratricopeptide repeat protein [Myxococcales bacterium]|jgi:hypothetical protein
MELLRPLLLRLRGLARCRLLLGAAVAGTLAGALLTRLPLFEVPGFELAWAMTAMLALLAGAAGIVAARQARARLAEPQTPRAPEIGLAFGAASLFCGLVLLLPLLAAVVGALASTRCDPWTGVGFYALLPVPTLLLGAACGVAAGCGFHRAWTAGLAYAALLLASFAVSLWPLWAGPQVFALNHFFGYFPGPLYDEALSVDSRLVAHRVLTLLWTALGLVGAAILRDARSGHPAFPLRRGLALAFTLAGIAGFQAFSFHLGLGTSDEALARALGGRSETEHFILHYPRTKPAEEVRRLERDLEYAWSHLSAFLGAAPEGKVTAWFHRSPGEKRRLVGAAHTDYAKPWRREFHVSDEDFPHRTARHELAHVFGAAFGSPFFGVSARRVVWVNIGLVEGLAVAADNRPDELTLHQWSAAMRRLKLAPDIRAIVDPVGFYGQPPSRAYTLAGSFLRFLADRYGAGSLRALYPGGDFAKAFGKPLDELAREWESFLDAMPLSERALHTAEVRFERGSIFARPCAREVALLRGEAVRMHEADPDRALGLYRRCQEIEPGNPAHLRGEAELLHARGDFEGALGLWRALLAQAGDGVAARAQALMALGDLAWEQGNLAQARESFSKLLDLHRDQATDRTAWVKLESLEDTETGPVLRRFFARRAGLAEVLLLDEIADRRPDWATAPYLIGRQLFNHGAPADAVPYLERARALGLGQRELAIENLRVLGTALYLAGDCRRAREVWDALTREGDEADQVRAADWIARCEFEERTFGGPLKPTR